MPKKVFKVQKQVAFRGKTAAGQKVMTVGRVWETIATYTNKTVAERTAQNARVDNPDTTIQVVEGVAADRQAEAT